MDDQIVDIESMCRGFLQNAAARQWAVAQVAPEAPTVDYLTGFGDGWEAGHVEAFALVVSMLSGESMTDLMNDAGSRAVGGGGLPVRPGHRRHRGLSRRRRVGAPGRVMGRRRGRPLPDVLAAGRPDRARATAASTAPGVREGTRTPSPPRCWRTCSTCSAPPSSAPPDRPSSENPRPPEGAHPLPWPRWHRPPLRPTSTTPAYGRPAPTTWRRPTSASTRWCGGRPSSATTASASGWAPRCGSSGRTSRSSAPTSSGAPTTSSPS